MAKARKKVNDDLKGTKLEPKGKLKPVKTTVKKLHTNNLKQAEFARQNFRILPESDHTVADTVRPEYWAHVAAKLVITDRIEALWKDSTRFVEYIVTDVGPQWAKVVIINDVDLTKAEESKAPEKATEFEVSYGNNQDRYIVTRLSDGLRISKDHQTRDAAELWLSEHKKSQ